MIGFVIEAGHTIVPGGAGWPPTLKRLAARSCSHPAAIASSCDHAGRDGFRLCLIGRLAGLPSHLPTSSGQVVIKTLTT